MRRTVLLRDPRPAARSPRQRPWLLLLALLTLAAFNPQARPQRPGTQPEDPQLTLRPARQSRFLHPRRVAGHGSPAAALDRARRTHLDLLAQPRASSLSAPWSPVGPGQIVSPTFGNLTGRVTSLALDPADATGNTLYVGTTGGGVWKSTNAAGPVAAVTFLPLTDTLPVFNAGAGSSAIASLSIGALALGNGILLAGTGDPNDASDSYYGAGILRSADGGATWTLIQQSLDGAAGNHAFFGLSFAALSFSSLNPSVAVAAVSRAAEGELVNAPDSAAALPGLYYTPDAGLTWHQAIVLDGGQVVQGPGYNGNSPATAVVWNPLRQRFYAAIQFHGYYQSPDGATWTRLAHQPGPGLTPLACPASHPSSACPLFRGALAVQPLTGDLFALSVDAQNHDGGLFQDVCNASATTCTNATVLFGSALDSTPLETGNGSSVIHQADYNLSLAAAPSGSDTVLFVGTLDLYRCTLASGCSLRNTTNAQNGCGNPAGVAPAQHALATLNTASGTLLYAGNDGGLYRSTDGVNQLAPPCSLDDARHFQNLNAALGSLAEVISFAQDPTQPGTLLAGLGALGSAGTANAPSPWPQLAPGEGGTTAIDQADPRLWFLSNGAGVHIARCTAGAACTPADFTPTAIGPAQTAGDLAAIHAPWLLDPQSPANLILGTCRVWRGPAAGGSLWSSSNLLSPPLGAPAASACSATFPVIRSLAAGGPLSPSANAPAAGSQVLYAGLAGILDGGQGFGGHLFTTSQANVANASTPWTDLASSPVVNDFADAGQFNPGGFDVSSIHVDPHDPTGRTVYATIMGFAANGTNAPHLYRSVDAGAHWTNVSSNLPNAPANSVLVDPNDANTLYVALDTGVYVTSQIASCTSGNCWTVFGSSLPNSPVVELLAAPALPTGDGRVGELRAATYGRGIWQIPLLTALAAAAPAISLSPASLSFPVQQVGTASQPLSILVTNTGNAPLSVSSSVTTGDFTQTGNCTAAPIAPGATCTVQVSFLPTASGARTGLLTVYGNIPGGQAVATLTGTATPPAAILLTPSSLSFPATTIGALSPSQNITVSNTGGVSTQLHAPILSAGFQLSANTCGASLAPGTGCTLSILFAPSALGQRSGTLSITDDAGTQVASLSGSGTSPATDSLSPLALSFAAQPLNTSSPTQQVTLTNAGSVPLTLISAHITSGDFTVVDGCGASLNPQSSCTFNVAFVPKNVGSQTGSLAIADVARSQTIALNGTGIAPAGVSLAPSNGLSFPATAVTLAAPTQTVTLTNNGGVPLTLSAIAATGDFYLLPGSNTCGTSLAPTALCTVQVGFAPTVPGLRSGLLTFADSASNSPQVLQLTGTGIDFSLNPEGPASLSLSSGGTATYTLLLASAPALPGNVTFTCAGLPVHASCTMNPGNASLGGSTVVTVTVATGLAGAALHPPVLPASLDPAHPTPNPAWLACLLPLAAFLRRRGPRARLASFLLGLLLLSVAGCSTGRTLPFGSVAAPVPIVTPSGTYSLLVAGSGANLVRSVSLTLIVQ